ncbi:hypothetical protein SCHPADRAFT_911833 [Schizopora paradoxa]|uniref:Uncharacterized protein n=1 Tax=Schizopora paradoxa TaxID=27342 RepID=A0A0H2QX33_9AGAM|nr:hypothetical protein SCHPADRAFT_911833 [Schizopora paradoxa]
MAYNQEQTRRTAASNSTVAISLLPYQSPPAAYAMSASPLDHHEDESEELRTSMIYQVCKMRSAIDGLNIYADQLEKVILSLLEDSGRALDFVALQNKMEEIKKLKTEILERERASAREKARELQDSFESYLQNVMQCALKKDGLEGRD